MRGRLTADKVNAALDELAALAEGNAAMVAAVRRNRATGPDKKHAMWVAFNVAVSPGRLLGPEHRHLARWCCLPPGWEEGRSRLAAGQP